MLFGPCPPGGEPNRSAGYLLRTACSKRGAAPTTCFPGAEISHALWYRYLYRLPFYLRPGVWFGHLRVMGVALAPPSAGQLGGSSQNSV